MSTRTLLSAFRDPGPLPPGLYLAARNNRHAVVELLMANEAALTTLNVADIHGRTPIVAASGACAPKVVGSPPKKIKCIQIIQLKSSTPFVCVIAVSPIP